MSNTHELSIAMVGPTGVGKTSLLASMYKDFQSAVNELDCRFAVDARSKADINERLLELQAIAKGKKARISNEVGIKGSTEAREYDFTLGVPWEKGVVPIKLKFVDLPGGWYAGYGNPEKANAILSQSTISFWCVDATALMEDKGDYHEEINNPQAIFDSYQTSLPEDHHIHFTVIRSESYIGDRDTLARQMQTQYRRYVSTLSKRCTITCSSVQTVGNVLFHKWNEDKESGRPKAEFRIDRNKGGYSPTGCEFPIAVAIYYGLIRKLDQLIKQYEEEYHPGTWIYEFFGGVTDAISQARAVYRALNQMLNHIDESYIIELQ